MSKLQIFLENQPELPKFVTNNPSEIAAALEREGVIFERWEAKAPINEQTTEEEILRAYKPQIELLIQKNGYQTFDVVNMSPNHPQKDVLRQKFLAEHTHSEDEVRFFVRGKGLFTLHLGEQVYEIICEQNDLISVPAATPHWFDMGDKPCFTCIRLFNSKDGWVAQYTGSDIASKFSTLE